MLQLPWRRHQYQSIPEREHSLSNVNDIYTSPAKGQAMVRRLVVFAVKGKGLVGDRYHTDNILTHATYKNHRIPNASRNITLIAEHGIQEAQTYLKNQGFIPFTSSETRRNIVLKRITAEELNTLEQRKAKIRIGNRLTGVTIQLTDLANPCNVPSKQYGKTDFLHAFEGRGGVRGEILRSGLIFRSSKLHVLTPKS